MGRRCEELGPPRYPPGAYINTTPLLPRAAEVWCAPGKTPGVVLSRCVVAADVESILCGLGVAYWFVERYRQEGVVVH